MVLIFGLLERGSESFKGAKSRERNTKRERERVREGYTFKDTYVFKMETRVDARPRYFSRALQDPASRKQRNSADSGSRPFVLRETQTRVGPRDVSVVGVGETIFRNIAHRTNFPTTGRQTPQSPAPQNPIARECYAPRTLRRRLSARKRGASVRILSAITLHVRARRGRGEITGGDVGEGAPPLAGDRHACVDQ